MPPCLTVQFALYSVHNSRAVSLVSLARLPHSYLKASAGSSAESDVTVNDFHISMSVEDWNSDIHTSTSRVKAAKGKESADSPDDAVCA